MRIYKDKKTGKYHADYVLNGKRLRPALHTTSSSVAHLRAAELISKQKAINGDIDLANYKLKDFTNRFTATIHKAPKTINTYKYAIRLLEDFIPSYKKTPIKYVTELTPDFLNELVIFLSKKTPDKNAGINRNIRAIKAMMRWGEKHKDIKLPKQEWENVIKLKENKGRLEFHTIEELQEILSIMPSLEHKVMVKLGARAGLRRGEIAMLKWQDVDLEHCRIWVAPNKTENGRHIPLTTDLLDDLKFLKNNTKGSFVINIGDVSRRTTKDYLTATYSKITHKLGFHCTMHKLRHTFASHLVQNGVDLYTVSKLLGHSNIEMTEIYAHLAPDTFTAAIKKLPVLSALGSKIGSTPS